VDGRPGDEKQRLASERERLRAELREEMERLHEALREAAGRVAERERELAALRARAHGRPRFLCLLRRGHDDPGGRIAPASGVARGEKESPADDPGQAAAELVQRLEGERRRLRELRRLLSQRQALLQRREREVEELRARLELARRRLLAERRQLADRLGRVQAGEPWEVSFSEGLRRVASAARRKRTLPSSQRW